MKVLEASDHNSTVSLRFILVITNNEGFVVVINAELRIYALSFAEGFLNRIPM